MITNKHCLYPFFVYLFFVFVKCILTGLFGNARVCSALCGKLHCLSMIWLKLDTLYGLDWNWLDLCCKVSQFQCQKCQFKINTILLVYTPVFGEIQVSFCLFVFFFLFFTSCATCHAKTGYATFMSAGVVVPKSFQQLCVYKLWCSGDIWQCGRTHASVSVHCYE